MNHLPILLALSALVSGCSRRPPAGPAGSGAPPAAATAPGLPDVRVWGSLRAIMHEGKTGPQVSLAEAITGTPHVYGVGALSSLRGEVTIIDGTVWLAHSDDRGGVRVGKGISSAESATLLVAAQVRGWRDLPISAQIAPDDLDDRIEAMARDSGIDVDRPFPLLVEGRFLDADWHVLDGRRIAPGGGHDDHARNSIKGTIRNGTGVLVGFFSKQHQGVFTHMGQRTHFHLLTSDHATMGHADRVGVHAGSTLKLPLSSK
jgi:alpha-acetolactate decarboxylase